jgi:hypothetical protein
VSYYIGASLVPLLNMEWLYSIPFLIFFLFFLGRMKRKKRNSDIGEKTDEQILTKSNTNRYIAFVVVLIVCLVLSATLSVDCLYYLAFAVLCSVYLAIFESWFFIVNEKKGGSGSLRLEREKSIIGVVKAIITISPMFLLTIYPYVGLGIIFGVSFIIFHLFAQTLWFTKIHCYLKTAKPSESIRTEIKVSRIIFGALVFIILIADRLLFNYIHIAFQEFINKSNFDLSNFIQSLISSVILIILITPFVDFLVGKQKKSTTNGHKQKKEKDENAYESVGGFMNVILKKRTDCLQVQMISLVFPLMVPLVSIPLLNDTFAQFKILLTFIGCFAFIIFDVIQIIYFRDLNDHDTLEIEKNE